MEITVPSPEEKKALAELNSILLKSEKFVKAHAAEYLIWTGHRNAALKEFLEEEHLYSAEPKYRVVIWRVLAQAEADPLLKKMWMDKIYQAYTDLDGPDRTHATETLAKLKQPVADLFPEETAYTLKSPDRNLQTYALWASAVDVNGQICKNKDEFLDKALRDSDLTIRRISAFVLRQSKGLNLEQWQKLASVILTIDPKEELYVTLLATVLVTAPTDANQDILAEIKKILVKGAKKYSASQRIDLSQAFAEKGEEEQLPVLMDILESEEDPDARAAAAYGILKIKGRQIVEDSLNAAESNK
ncbi:hypothetical protein [Pedobacter heparinus]|uniref:hypothetical protein n=1 Tax=Pedobacter heparinus TaxID=984 RepID=UPI00292CA9B0|nr:hypothetical protein [Pedobacter heparinus]